MNNPIIKFDTNLISKAREFAIDSHKDQKYGIHPYSKHLSDEIGRAHV